MTTTFRALLPSSYVRNMDIKHEMIYRDDDVLHVKSEPQLYSPTTTVNGATIAVGNLLTAANNGGLIGTTSNNGLIVTSNGAGAFGAFVNSVSISQGAQSITKRSVTRTEDFLGSPSPGTMSGNNVPPLTPSPGPPAQAYTVISNGYPSPMSSGSYDPYSPNGKIEK